MKTNIPLLKKHLVYFILKLPKSRMLFSVERVFFLQKTVFQVDTLLNKILAALCLKNKLKHVAIL